MALKIIIFVAVTVFLWLMTSCSGVELSGVQIKGEVGKKNGIVHGNLRMHSRKKISKKKYKLSRKVKINDSKATSPGHSPGIGHSG